MRRITYPALPFALVLGLAFVSSACGSSTTTEVTAPTSLARCQATLQGAPASFGPSGGTGSLSVTLSRECAWSATTTATWIEITSGREGQGAGSIAYIVHANNDPVTRRAAIAVGEERVDMTQEGAPCRFSLSRSGDSIAAEGGQRRVDISTHQACRWTAAANVQWVTLAPPAGTGPGTVQVSAAVNSGAARTATVVIAGEPLVFTQAAQASGVPPPPTPTPDPPGPPAPPPPPPPPAPPPPPTPGQCSFEIAPGEATFTFLGGVGSFTLTTGADCAWTVASDDAWITVTGSASGSGTTSIGYLVLPNTLPTSRAGAIRVGQLTHRVQQSGVVDDGDDADDVQVSGIVSELSGSCPALRFSVQGSVVITDGQTTFKGGNCSRVKNGLKVEVTGSPQPDSTIRAAVVRLDK